MADYTYKAKVGQRWLRGNSLVDTEKDADTFESKTEPTQRINQMKKDGKISKGANVEIVKENGNIDYNERANNKLFENTLGESSLKEFFFYAPPYDEENEEKDTIIGYIAAVRDYQTQKTKYVDDNGNVCNSKSQAKAFDTKEKADYYSYKHCPEGWTHFVVALKNSDILKEGRLNYAAILQETKSMTQDLYDFVVNNWIYDDELQDANNSAELADIIKSRIESGWGPDVTDHIIQKVAGFLWEDYF